VEHDNCQNGETKADTRKGIHSVAQERGRGQLAGLHSLPRVEIATRRRGLDTDSELAKPTLEWAERLELAYPYWSGACNGLTT